MISFFKGILFLVVARCAGVLAQGPGPADFTGAQWIWFGSPDSNDSYPVGNVTFRRDYSPPSGRISVSANISITADNAYTLYVNGLQIGDGGDHNQAEGYCVRLDPERNVFAVVAQNQALAPNLATTPNPAGLLAAISIRFSDGLTDTIGTDGQSWRAVMGTPTGFEQAASPQGAWPNTSPWNNIPQVPSFNRDISCASANLTSGKGRTNIGAIVGGVVGGVGGFIIIAGLAMWLRRRKHKAHFALKRHSVYTPFYPDLVDRSLATNAGMSFFPPSVASTTSPSDSGSSQLRAEIGQLRRQMEALRTERIQEFEPPPMYADGGENIAGQVSTSVSGSLVPSREKS